MKNYILFLCALATIGFASSCKSPTDFDVDRTSDKDTTAKPAQTELAGEWFLESYEQFGSPMQYVANGQIYSLNFKDSKNANGKANCNTFTATYQADSLVLMTTKVSFKNISSTKMNCNTADIEAKYLSMLGSAIQFTVSSEALKIGYFNAVDGFVYSMVFKRKEAQPAIDLLKGTEWTLTEVEHPSDTAIGFMPDGDMMKYTLSFAEIGNAATGTTGCTTFKTNYTLFPAVGNNNRPGLNFHPVDAANWCSTQSDRFIRTLGNVEEYMLSGNTLMVFYSEHASNKLVMLRFDKVTKDSNSFDRLILTNPLPTLNTVPFDPFTFRAISIDGDFLTINTEYIGGCAQHEFVMYGKIDSLQTTLQGIEMLLSHNAKNDQCKSLMEDTQTFNLLPIRQKYKEITGKQNGQIILNIRSYGNSKIYNIIYNF